MIGLNVIIQSTYAIKVCPYIENLSTLEVIIANLIIATLMVGLRHLIFRRIYIPGIVHLSSKKHILTDAIVFLTGGIIWGLYNNFVHHFPINSTLKILSGFLSTGILTGISLFIIRKVSLLNTNQIGEEYSKLNVKHYSSISGDLLGLAMIMIVLVSINGMLIIYRDLTWIVHQEISYLDQAAKSVITEVLFVAIVYSFYILLISVYYSKYLKIQLTNQKKVLNEISSGNLNTATKVLGDDEFGVIANYTNKMIHQLREHLEVTKSIEYSKKLQDALMPGEEQLNNSLHDHFCLFMPRDIVSGDFYWTEKKGDILFFAVADSTGHGVPGAMVSIICINSLNRVIKEFSLEKPADILTKVRALVIESFCCNDKNVRDGMDISLCALNTKTYELSFAGAQNPLWILSKTKISGAQQFAPETKKQSDWVFQEIPADRHSVCYYADLLPFTNHTVQLNKGDIVYLFSDGYSDQFGGPKGKKFKRKAFKSLVYSMADLDSNQQKDTLFNTINDWRGDLSQIDDICVIGKKI